MQRAQWDQLLRRRRRRRRCHEPPVLPRRRESQQQKSSLTHTHHVYPSGRGQEPRCQGRRPSVWTRPAARTGMRVRAPPLRRSGGFPGGRDRSAREYRRSSGGPRPHPSRLSARLSPCEPPDWAARLRLTRRSGVCELSSSAGSVRIKNPRGPPVAGWRCPVGLPLAPPPQMPPYLLMQNLPPPRRGSRAAAVAQNLQMTALQLETLWRVPSQSPVPRAPHQSRRVPAAPGLACCGQVAR